MATKRLRLRKIKNAESCFARVSRSLNANAPRCILEHAAVSGMQHCDYINLMEARGHHVGVHPSFVYEIALPLCCAVAGDNTTTHEEGFPPFLRSSRDSSHYPSLTVPSPAEKKSRFQVAARAERVYPRTRRLATSSGNWTVVGIAAVYGNNVAI